MKKSYRLTLLILIGFIFIPILSGCKGASSSSPSSSSPSPSSSALVKTSATGNNRLSFGLWKMTVSSTTQIPSIAGRPPMSRSWVNTVTECIKPNSKKAKPYMMKPSNFNCSNVKEHVAADGTVHWSMRCKNPTMTFSSKGITKISVDSFTSRATTTETTPSGFLIKTIVNDKGKHISDKCPSNS